MRIDATIRQRREPVTRLYDGACELLFAAQNLRAAAADGAAMPAVAATIGCVEATLDAVADAIAEMRRGAVAEASRGDDERQAAAALAREFGALEEALRSARSVCDGTRESTAPILARLTLG